MTAALFSVWDGIGVGALAVMCRKVAPKAIPIQASFLDAAIYGTAVSLIGRGIEECTREHLKDRHLTKNASMQYATAIIVIKILIPYLLRSSFQKSLKVEIPKSFIHLENAIYVASVLDGEGKNTAARLKPEAWEGHKDRRFLAIPPPYFW